MTNDECRVEVKAVDVVGALQLATRAAVAAGLSVVAAQWLRLQFPLYAMIAAVILIVIVGSIGPRWHFLRLVLFGGVVSTVRSIV